MASALLSCSIIGTAGRGGKKDRTMLTKHIFDKAIDKAKQLLTEHFKLSLDSVHLVSGGAAWADHIAVSLFLLGDVHQLTLHLPTSFIINDGKPQFKDLGIKDFKKNPGRTANQYHEYFSKCIHDNSLQQIQSAIDIGAHVKVHDGFHARNSHVAKSDYLIAFTWNDGNEPKKGTGTYDTWKKCKSRNRIHICMSSLLQSS